MGIWTSLCKAPVYAPHCDAEDIHYKLVQWIESFLGHRKQRVLLDGCRSSQADVVSGVSQGTVSKALYSSWPSSTISAWSCQPLWLPPLCGWLSLIQTCQIRCRCKETARRPRGTRKVGKDVADELSSTLRNDRSLESIPTKLWGTVKLQAPRTHTGDSGQWEVSWCEYEQRPILAYPHRGDNGKSIKDTWLLKA